MPTGAITSNIDVAQVVLYVFWIFFAFLILYLRREDKREGYPLESDRSPHVVVQGFPAMPSPKVFRLPDGRTQEAPRPDDPQIDIAASPAGPWPGAPLVPDGDPMVDAVGPASYALRHDAPELTFEGEPKIQPMRALPHFIVDERDPDPRGLPVFGADNLAAGTVSDLWVDLPEPQIRYLEVTLDEGEPPRTVLLPIGFAIINGRKLRPHVKVASLLAEHFQNVPTPQSPNQITLREEDQITAYYASGHLYALPSRSEPLI